MLVPLIYDALSDIRKATTSATSFALPKRLAGMAFKYSCLNFSGTESVISVSIKPGAMLNILMACSSLNAETSRARDFDRAANPALVAE